MSLATRAAVLRNNDQPLVIEEITLADLMPSEILVQVVGAGFCHSDLTFREIVEEEMPMILGHEGAGIVTEVGSAVTGICVGDHVVMSFVSCGSCPSCLQGKPAYCIQFRQINATGRYLDGTTSASDNAGKPVANRFFGQSSFAGHVIADECNVVRIDPDVPLELLGPLGCGIQTGAACVINEMQLRPGQSIAIFGAGGVGLAAVMAAKLCGASDIVVIDLHESRLRMAEELGATRTVSGTVDDLAASVIGSGPGMDFAFETTGVGNVLTAAISVLGVGGLAVLVATYPDDVGISPMMLIGRKVTFAVEGNAVPKLFIPQLIRFWKEGRFPFDKLVRTYRLDDINEAIADSTSGATIKAVLIP